jgi:GTP cyclohydrolase FolE2
VNFQKQVKAEVEEVSTCPASTSTLAFYYSSSERSESRSTKSISHRGGGIGGDDVEEEGAFGNG